VKPAPHVVEPTVIEPARPTPPTPEPEPAVPAPAVTSTPEREPEPEPEPVVAEVPAPEPAPTTTTAAGSTLTLVDVRRLWPDIVEATKQRRRLTWIYLTQQAQVVAVDDETLTLGFTNAGARDSFDGGGSAEIVRQAAIDVVGHDWRVETIVDPGADPEAAPPPPGRPAESASPAGRSADQQTGTPVTPEPVPSEAPEWARPASETSPESSDSPPARPSAPARDAIASARESRVPADRPAEADGGARDDDTDAESSGLDGAELLQEALGAQVIEEIHHP
jgi:DNA polymerase-3 subunit gamma/tau